MITAILMATAALQAAEGASPKTLDPMAMGLVCDGSTDNAVVLAKISVQTAAFPGQIVAFPPAQKPCLSSKPLVATAHTIYTAAPNSITLEPTKDNTANPVLFQSNNVSDITVTGLNFDGNSKNINNVNNLITVYQSSGVVFDHVSVRNTHGIAVAFSTGVVESGIQNSSFLNIGNDWERTRRLADQKQGVVFCCGSNNLDNFVTASSFEKTGLDAISFTQQQRFTARNNHFLDVGGGSGGRTGSRIDAPAGMSGGAAIYGADSIGADVAHNWTDGAGGNGIDLFKVSNAQVTDNWIRRSGGNGISFAAGSHAAITDNTVLDNNQADLQAVSAPQAGIFLSGGRKSGPAVTDVTIARNISTDKQAHKTQNYGIQIQDGSTSSNIDIDGSNQLTGNKVAELGEAAGKLPPSLDHSAK